MITGLFAVRRAIATRCWGAGMRPDAGVSVNTTRVGLSRKYRRPALRQAASGFGVKPEPVDLCLRVQAPAEIIPRTHAHAGEFGRIVGSIRHAAHATVYACEQQNVITYEVPGRGGERNVIADTAFTVQRRSACELADTRPGADSDIAFKKGRNQFLRREAEFNNVYRGLEDKFTGADFILENKKRRIMPAFLIITCDVTSGSKIS